MKIQSTEASNKIEGIVTTSTRMKQLFEEKTTPRNRDEDEIMGYRDVLNTIHESNEYIPIRPSYILQLHRDLLKRAGFSYGGHFKNVQNYINETKPDGTVVTRFTPIAPYDTPDAVENLCNAYEQAVANEKIDSLILIPTFICDFLCIHPFNDGNVSFIHKYSYSGTIYELRDDKKTHPVVIIGHGFNSSKDNCADTTKYYCKAGYAVVIFDFVGGSHNSSTTYHSANISSEVLKQETTTVRYNGEFIEDVFDWDGLIVSRDYLMQLESFDIEDILRNING